MSSTQDVSQETGSEGMQAQQSLLSNTGGNNETKREPPRFCLWDKEEASELLGSQPVSGNALPDTL